jgi:hypothetical protein
MSLMRRCIITFASLTAVAGSVESAAAQIPLTPRALGMGGAYTATARGFESIFFNPANLALPDTPDWSISFPQITVGSSVLGPEVSDLPDFIRKDDQTAERRQELLATIPESGTSVDLVVRAPIASLSVGRIGVGLSYGWTGEHTLGKDLVDLFLLGFEEGRFDYSVGNTVGTRASFWDLAAGYAREVGPITLGATGHYYRGGSVVRTMAFERDIDPFAQTIEVEYAGVYSDGGTGYGVDFGAAMQPFPGITVSAAVANAVSSMSWDDELTGRRIVFTEQDFEDSEFFDLENRWNESEESVDTPGRRYDQIVDDLNLDAYDFPMTMKLGAAWNPLSGTEIGVSYQSEIADDDAGLLGGRWNRLVGIGVQQKIPLVTLRAGASTNLDEGSMLGAGLKLGVLDLAVAKFNTVGDLVDSERDGWAGSFSINVRTRGTIGN